MNKTQKNEKNAFPSGLKDFLSRCKLDEKDISKKCGVSLPLVYNWLNGKNIPTYKSLQKLFELGMLPEEMFCFVEDHERIESVEQINNLNQKDLKALKSCLLFTSTRELTLTQIKNGLQNSFNDLKKDDKIKLLCRVLELEIATVEDINSIIKDVLSDNLEILDYIKSDK